MTMNKTSIASASDSSSSQAPSTYGLRSQLGNLLPKHALFQVHLHIEQLSNVPLVSGQFGVRWKFRNVHNSSGILAKMKQRSVSSPSVMGAKKDKGKGRMEPQIEITHHEDHASIHSSTEGDMTEHVRASFTSHPNGSTLYGQYLTASPPQTPQTPPATLVSSSQPPSPPAQDLSEGRGITPWVPLKSYNAQWDYHVNTIVQMDVHRDTGDLLPCELKLVIVQRVIQGDLDSPQRPRLGAVYLNLAEYANAGPVTRRYLLRDSKTNATLKLTIDVEWLGGEKSYRPPPLRKSEIMASVTGLLSNNDLFHTQLARDLDLYTRVDDDDWAEGISRANAAPYATPEGLVDFDRLAANNGLRTTENLIDALFNPVPTANEKASPFTYFDPAKARELEQQAWAAERQSTHSSSDSSLTGGSGGKTPSVYTAGSENSSGNGQDAVHKHWWQKIRSGGSSTPLSRHFRPSTPQTGDFPRRSSS